MNRISSISLSPPFDGNFFLLYYHLDLALVIQAIKCPSPVVLLQQTTRHAYLLHELCPVHMQRRKRARPQSDKVLQAITSCSILHPPVRIDGVYSPSNSKYLVYSTHHEQRLCMPAFFLSNLLRGQKKRDNRTSANVG